MSAHSRREFLADVGRGMLVAGVGASLAHDLALAPAWASETPKRLNFGKLEPLVALMQETPTEQLIPRLLEEINRGVDLRTLTAAGSLANARTFGGNDYIGFHTFMALGPALEMSKELPEAKRALPVLKVLYRNSQRMHERGGDEALHHVEPTELPKDQVGGEVLRDAVHKADWKAAEGTFAALAKGPIGEAFNHLQFSVQDEVDVHRTVLSWRAWQTLDVAGQEQAHTLLRQSVRYCLDVEEKQRERKYPVSAIRTTLPKLLDQYRLLSKSIGERKPDDSWLESMSRTICNGSRDQAADAVAAALAEGIAPEAIGEAISLAANRLVLLDVGREARWSSSNKPAGSVHGDSVGVHASDSANAWRNIARVSNHRNTVASMIVGAYHTGGQATKLHASPYPFAEHLETITAKDPDRLIQEADAAIRAKDQIRACALVHRYGELGISPRPIFDLLLKFAVSEDGALHAEKYYRTVTEEFATTRQAFRWRQLSALARVTASEFGYPAPGYEEACRRLKV